MPEPPELFRELCENANDLIQCVSPEGGFVYVNAAWLRTLGYERKEVSGLGFLDVIHPDSRGHCRQIMSSLVAGLDAVRVDADFITKDGRRVAVEGSVRCWPTEGVVVSTQGVFRDVTQRKYAQEELDRLFDLSLDLLCVAGTDGFFKQINPAFEQVLGYSREELLSRAFLEFVHEEDREQTLLEVENLARGQVVVDFQNRYRTRNGDYRWLAWRATPLPDRGLIYAVARDITDSKRTHETMHRQAEELARSNADLEQFAYVASHDLRAPLRSVRKLASWIGEELPGETPQKARQNLDRLQDRIERLDSLIGDLLRYSRAGREPGEIESVDVAVLVDELKELLAPSAGFVIRTETQVPSFPTDRAALAQVLRNLIGNALKHHDREAGEVVVSAQERGEELLFSVSDDGPGVASEHHERVFEAFRRVQTGKRAEGSGLGLALVKRLVEAHAGRVWLEPANDRGLRVCFTWPRRLEPDLASRE
jgi:PAS domain S-box-containing protein